MYLVVVFSGVRVRVRTVQKVIRLINSDFHVAHVGKSDTIPREKRMWIFRGGKQFIGKPPSYKEKCCKKV
jgi:hypothetical protein